MRFRGTEAQWRAKVRVLHGRSVRFTRDDDGFDKRSPAYYDVWASKSFGPYGCDGCIHVGLYLGSIGDSGMIEPKASISKLRRHV